MSAIKKIILFFCVFANLFSFLVTCVAVETGVDYKQQSDFWTWIAGGNSFLNDFIGYTTGLVCPDSEDGYHHASSYVKSDENGYYLCVCRECGERFEGYLSDAQQSYDDQVSELPASGVTSSGGLLYNPLDYPTLVVVDTRQVLNVPLSSFPVTSGYDTFTLVSSSYSYVEHVFMPDIANACYSFLQVHPVAPVSGVYTVVYQPRLIWSYVDSNNNTFNFDSALDPKGFNTVPTVSGGSYNAGNDISRFSFEASTTSGGYLSESVYANIKYFPPIYEIIPFDTSVVTNNYTINSRPTSITGDYGIIGDNGEITYVESTTIVNETNNTFTNPSTGTTSIITEWTYDYLDRSYNLTLDTGDTVTVTYGDENVTIQDGDTVYNIYYIIVDGTGQGTAPDTCQHKYTSTVDRDATCTVPGQATYTCSLCGHTYTEAIPAKGHTWTILQTVTTEYDEEGNLLQQGYTLYQCSICGEQYKDEDGTGPPGSAGSDDGESIWDKLGNFLGSIFGGLIGLIEAILGAILDALTSLVAIIGEKLGQVVALVLAFFDYIPGLFSGFLGFLSAAFPFLPEDVMLLITFGIAVVVFIGIIKALRR